MTVEAWSAIAAWATFIVIAASAIAALVQLRHLRTGNQLTGLLSFLEMLQAPDTRDLLNFVRHDLLHKLNDNAFVESLDEVPIDRRTHPELYVCQLYEHIGSYVRTGLIDERTFMMAAWYDVHLYWTLLEPVVRIARRRRPYIFENFEFLAASAQWWMKDHPRGNYPKKFPRMARS